MTDKENFRSKGFKEAFKIRPSVAAEDAYIEGEISFKQMMRAEKREAKQEIDS